VLYPLIALSALMAMNAKGYVEEMLTTPQARHLPGWHDHRSGDHCSGANDDLVLFGIFLLKLNWVTLRLLWRDARFIRPGSGCLVPCLARS